MEIQDLILSKTPLPPQKPVNKNPKPLSNCFSTNFT